MTPFEDQRESLRKDFKRRGLRKNDINIALEIFTVLAYLDQQLFPGNHARINLCPVPSKKKSTAHYCHPQKRYKEHYTIFIPGLYAQWKNGNHATVLEERNGGVVSLPKHAGRMFTWKEFALGIAVHEVRHRLQFQYGRRLKKFNAWTFKQAGHPLLLKLGKFIHITMVYQRKYMRLGGFKKRFVRKRTDSYEFDAMLIENLFLHRYRKISTREDVLKLIMAGPRSVV